MALLSKFQIFQTSERLLMQLQQNIATALNPVTSNPLLAGVQVSVTFTASDVDTQLTHNLGTSKIGILPGIPSIEGIVYASPNQTAMPKNSVFLRAFATTLSLSNPLTMSFWVYPLA